MSFVPSQYAGPGGVSASPEDSRGSNGASAGAASPAHAMARTMRGVRRRPVTSGDTWRAQTAVGELDGKVGRQNSQAAKEENGLQDGIVARADRFEPQQAETGHGEDAFDHQRAAEDVAEPHAEQRQHGQQ